MKCFERWAFGVVLLLMASPAQAQEMQLHVSADSVFVGERFTLSVTVKHASGSTITFPDVPLGDAEMAPLLQFGDAEVFTGRRLPPRLNGVVRVDSMVYEAATFALDEATLGPVVVTLLAGDDTTRLQTGTATLPVRSVLPSAETELLPPTSPEPFPSPWLAWALFALGALALLALLVWAWRRFRGDSAPLIPRPAPYPEAIQRLDVLSLPTENNAIKAYYIELADVLRTYLARTLHLPALELTTRELTAILQNDSRVPPEAVKATRGTLRLADLVKFADLRPDADTHAAAREKARAAIEATERTVHPPEPEEGPKADDD